jgi:parvulin-like peptidyl-prolyl isomerase
VRQSDVEALRAEARLGGSEGDAEAALEAAIDRELVRQEAERLGVAAEEEAVAARAAALTESLGGEAALRTALEDAAMNAAQFRASVAASVLSEAVQDARFPGVSAPDRAVRRFYDRNLAELFTRPAAVDLGAIFVRNEGIAGNAVKRLRAGRPFEEVSRQFTIDPETKDNSGHLGWVDPRSMPGALRKAVVALRRGELSEPVAGLGGVWVFKAFAVRASRVLPFSAVRAGIEEGLTRRKRAAALNAWLEKARADAAVVRL